MNKFIISSTIVSYILIVILFILVLQNRQQIDGFINFQLDIDEKITKMVKSLMISIQQLDSSVDKAPTKLL